MRIMVPVGYFGTVSHGPFFLEGGTWRPCLPLHKRRNLCSPFTSGERGKLRGWHRRRGRRRKGSPDRNKNNTARFIPKPCLKINELIGTAVQSILHTCSLFILHRYTFTSLVSPPTPSCSQQQNMQEGSIELKRNNGRGKKVKDRYLGGRDCEHGMSLSLRPPYFHRFLSHVDFSPSPNLNPAVSPEARRDLHHAGCVRWKGNWDAACGREKGGKKLCGNERKVIGAGCRKIRNGLWREIGNERERRGQVGRVGLGMNTLVRIDVSQGCLFRDFN